MNVQNALAIGSEQSRQFSASLSSESQNNGVAQEDSHCQGEGHLRRRDAVQSAVSRGAAAQH